MPSLTEIPNGFSHHLPERVNESAGGRTERRPNTGKILISVIRWTARCASILIALTFIAFVVGEVPNSTSLPNLRDWIGMTLLIAAILGLLCAWKWEFPAALISLFAIAGFVAATNMRRFDVVAIAVIPNLLFILDWKLRHSHFGAIPKAG